MGKLLVGFITGFDGILWTPRWEPLDHPGPWPEKRSLSTIGRSHFGGVRATSDSLRDVFVTFCTLWLYYNIAMGNDPFIDGLPIKNGGFSMVMLNHQRVTSNFFKVSPEGFDSKWGTCFSKAVGLRKLCGRRTPEFYWNLTKFNLLPLYLILDS